MKFWLKKISKDPSVRVVAWIRNSLEHDNELYDLSLTIISGLYCEGWCQVPAPGMTGSPGPSVTPSGSGSGNSLSFLSSVMRSSHANPGKIISKKLWRQRSKSQSRAAPQISSPWVPPADIKVKCLSI